MKPIHNPEAERALIASCVVEPRQLDVLGVEPGHFRNTQHQKIWRAMLSLPSPDAITISAESGVALSEINDILLDQVDFWNAEGYAKIVKDTASERKGAEIGGKIINDAYAGKLDIPTYIRELDGLTTVSGAGRPISKIVSDVSDIIMERMAAQARGEKVEIGYQTGVGYIDRNFKGLKKGWLVYLAGSPNVGKSQLAIQMSKVFAKQDPGCYVAIEGSEEGTAYRMLEGMTGVDAIDLEFGNIKDATPLMRAIEELEEVDYDFFYAPRLSVHELRAYVAKQKAERGIGWLVVDYVSLLQVEGVDKNEKDTNMSAELRRICGEFNILLLGLDSITKAGASKILSIEDIEGRFSKQHDSDITLGYSDYRVVGNIAPELNDFERQRACRLMGCLKDRYRKNKGKLFPLEMRNGLIQDMEEDSSDAGHWSDNI